MPNLIIQENNVNRTRPAVHGEELTIVAPCNCSEVSGVQIAGVAFPFYDAAGNVLESGVGWFAQGSLIRVLIDVDNTRAYILNAAIKGFVESMVGGNTGGNTGGSTGDGTNSLVGVEYTSNRDSVIDESASNNHYPSTLAVKNYVDSMIANIITVTAVASVDDIPSDAKEGNYYVLEG